MIYFLFLIALFFPSFLNAASFVYPVYSDTFVNECIHEEQLDDPRIWMDTKGTRLPPICLAPDTPLDPKIFAEAWGRELTPEEWAVMIYRSNYANGIASFVSIDDIVISASPVPLSESVVFSMFALSLLFMCKLFTRRYIRIDIFTQIKSL